MTKPVIDISAIQIVSDGAVILDDVVLQSLVDNAAVTSAGGDWEVNSNTCTNTSNCNSSTNGHCSNADGQCRNASNSNNCMIIVE